ncbi:amidohydrolase family protein [Nocardioides sp.]|uniref:amidohydrolase family protein n=1 Tax=Nocardioides sp. TaxID=35761 RepID=UPI0039E5EDEC
MGALAPGRLIDVHSHVVTDAYRAACTAAGIVQPDGFPALPPWSAAETLALMDAHGIDAAVLSVSSPGMVIDATTDVVALARGVNDEIAAVVADHPGRFGQAAAIPMTEVTAAIAEWRRARDELGADACGLMTNAAGRYLGDEAFEPLMAELDATGAVVIVHPTSPACWQAVSLGRPRPMLEFPFDSTRAVSNLLFNGVLRRYRDIRWVIPHSGGTLAVLGDRLTLFPAMLPGVPDDLDVLAELSRLYYDCAGTAFPRAMPTLASMVGTERLLYGTDFPFAPAAGVEAGAAAVARATLGGAPATDLFRANGATLFPRLGSSMEEIR